MNRHIALDMSMKSTHQENQSNFFCKTDTFLKHAETADRLFEVYSCRKNLKECGMFVDGFSTYFLPGQDADPLQFLEID